MDFQLTPRYLLAVLQLNQDLVESLKVGLAQAPSQLSIGLSRLESYTSAALMEKLANLGLMTGYTFKETKKKEPVASETALAYEPYVQFIKTHCIHTVATSVPLDCRNLSTAENQRIRAEHKVQELQVQSIDVDDPVAVAWRLARENEERARQRAGALYYLASQLQRGRLSTLEREHLEIDNQAIVSYFNQQARSFSHDEMMFAIVLGGAALESTRAKIFDEELNPRYNIVQYLQADRSMPGRYQSSVEDGFRAKLQAYRDNR